MTTELNEDICTIIFGHVQDFACLQATIEAASINKNSCLRDVVFWRLLQQPLRLSSDAIEGSEPLIQFLSDEKIANATSVQRMLQRIELRLGPPEAADYPNEPSANIEDMQYAGDMEALFSGEIPSVDPSDDSEEEISGGSENLGNFLMLSKPKRLTTMLPQLFSMTKNLRHLTWTMTPLPDETNLTALALLPFLESFSVDCATGMWSGRNMDNLDEYWAIEPFFRTLGPKLVALDLRNVNEDIFTIICDRFSSLTKLQDLKMDITCGCWDWDGRGSPQQGPSELFVFPRIGKNLRSFGLIVSDTTVSPSKSGPLDLVDAKKLEKLVLYVNHCYAYGAISEIELFQALSSSDYASLVHLELRDDVWHRSRWGWGPPDLTYFNEPGRVYAGIHEFLSALPTLRFLWVDERCLAVQLHKFEEAEDSDLNFSETEETGDADETDEVEKTGETERTEQSEEDMKRTIESPEWAMLAQTFDRLESLRVGFGPMDSYWVSEVLKLCYPKLLAQFGFYWDWRKYGKDLGISPDVFEEFARFPHLRDIHVLNPRPELGDKNFDDVILSNVEQIFEACPHVVRVGFGRNVVWERRTPWQPGKKVAQLLSDGKATVTVPAFFNAGSSEDSDSPEAFEELDQKGILEENLVLLDLLKRSSMPSAL